MKRKATKIKASVKQKVSIRQRMRMIAAAGALALGVFSASLIYNTLILNTDSRANEREKGSETLAEFKYRKLISINQEFIPGVNIYNYPVMLRMIDEDLKHISYGGKVASNKGEDIYFTAADGISILDFEIEQYDAASGELVAWVKIDSLSKLNPTYAYLYFSNKNASTASTQDAWNKSYRAVWHLKGLLNRKNPHANAVALNAKGGKDEQIVYIPSERNSSTYACLNTSEDVDITGEVSVSAWVYLTQNKGKQSIITNQVPGKGGYKLSIENKKLCFSIIGENGNVVSLSTAPGGVELNKNEWYHVAAVYSDHGDSMVTYINGRPDRSMQVDESLKSSGGNLQLGRDPLNKQFYFDGYIEDAMVLAEARHQDFIALDYINQEGSKLLQIGPTERVVHQLSSVLLSFEAEAAKKSVLLKWMTGREENLDQFTVERSRDGVNFEPIGQKQASGNTHEVLSYAFRDEKPVEGTSYYRLRVVNLLGMDEFSMVTPAKYLPESSQLSIHAAGPNPFIHQFNVEFTTAAPKVKIKLQNLQKDVLHEEELNCKANTPSTYSFQDTKHLPAGIYFVTISDNDQTQMVKLIKRSA